MSRIELDVIKPSIGGAVLSAFAAFLALFLHQFHAWQSFINKLQIPEILSNGESELVKGLLAVIDFTFKSYATYVLLVGFWLVVGVFVYFFIHGLGTVFHELSEGLQQRNYMWPEHTDHNQPIVSMFQKWGFWIMIAILFLLYTLIGLRYLFRWLGNLMDPSSSIVFAVLHGILYLVIGWFAFQLMIIMIRLLRFRTRIF